MHTAPKHLGGRAWKVPGYKDMVELDGTLTNIMPFNQDKYVDPWEISNGVRGLNGIAHHVMYVGGVDQKGKAKDTRNEEQKRTMEIYTHYMIARHPTIQVLGHYQAPGARKACPSFDVPAWLRAIGVAEKNIYNSP